MKQKAVDKLIPILLILCITIILLTMAIANQNSKNKLNQTKIIERLENYNYELVSSTNKSSIYRKKQIAEETLNIKVSKKSVIFEYIKETKENEYLSSIIQISINEKRNPKVIRVTGTKMNQPFSFQYYVEEDRLEYNPKNYIPADAWQISQNILGYFNDFQGLI